MKTSRVVYAFSFLAVLGAASAASGTALLIDHANTDLRALNQTGLQAAKADLHIAYGHTSHGSQVTDGMSALVGFINGGGLGLSYPPDFFRWNHGGTGGALDLHDYFSSNDLGNPNFTQWATDTRNYLNNPANANVNVIIWSWCGEVSGATATNINTYLGLMDQLEIDFPNVSFVHMTGHTDGCAPGGNLMVRNQQIRDHCATHGEILFDFADIESWDPNGNYYGNKRVNDNCDYDSDGDGTRDRNWAIDWQNAHTLNVDWYNCSAAHTQALNGNRKAYAAWALWNEIAALAAPATLTWKGGVDNKWDLGQTANWARNGVKRGYKEGDHVVLDDSGSGTLPISLAATVHPGSVLVSNSAINLTLGGAGSIAGACGLTKNGSGTLILATGNTYTGDTDVSGGTLLAENATGSATGTGAVTVGAATLGGTGFISGPVALTGDSVLTSTGTLTLGSTLTVQRLANQITSGTIFVTGDVTIDPAAVLIVNGTLASDSGVLHVRGKLMGKGDIGMPLIIEAGGTVSPGNPSSIGTLSQIANAGLARLFSFEIGGPQPNYATPKDSVNDLVRLTDAALPFANATGDAPAELAADTRIDIYFLFNDPPLGRYKAEFFAGTDFTDAIDEATVQYWRLDPHGSRLHNGNLFSPFDESLVDWSVVPEMAAFADGVASGYITQFTVAPEPTTLVFVTLGGLLALHRRRAG